MIRRNCHKKRPLLDKAAFFIYIALFLLIIQSFASAAAVKTINGRISKIDISEQRMDVDFEHPATGELKLLTFHIQDQTGLGGVESIEEFQPQDPITIDYEENDQGKLLAHYIKKVQLTGPPPGLEDFRGL